MIWIIITIIICVIIALKEKADTIEVGFSIIVGLFGGLIPCMLVSAIATVMGWNSLKVETHTEEYELVQIKDNTYTNVSGEIKGGVFVMSGYINSNLDAGFSYYQKVNNGYELKTVEAKDTTIRYTNETPKVVKTITYCPDRGKLPELGLLWLNGCSVGNGISKWVIYVPEESIVKGYKLGG